jgi:polyisoprenoid-binding protein YceI
MRTLLLMVILAGLMTSAVRAQQSLKADKSKSAITYSMKHALHAWTGESKDANCIIQLNSQGDIEKVAATVKVKTFDSKNSNRDSHMLEATDALTYPTVSFYSTSMTKTSEGYTLKGVLNFHGIERAISLDVKEFKSGNQRTITGGFVFLLEDHKVDRPTLFMIKTDNDVKIDFSFVF